MITTYDAAGRITRIANPNSVISYAYDAANQRPSETQAPVGGTPQTINYAFDPDGLTSALGTANAFGLEFTYNQRSLLSTVDDSAGNPYVAYSYDAAGNRLARSLANGTSTAYIYDGDNRLAKQTELSGQTTLRVSDYSYDVVNRIIGISHEGGGDDRSFAYTQRDELITANFGGPVPAPLTSTTSPATPPLSSAAITRAPTRSTTSTNTSPLAPLKQGADRIGTHHAQSIEVLPGRKKHWSAIPSQGATGAR